VYHGQQGFAAKRLTMRRSPRRVLNWVGISIVALSVATGGIVTIRPAITLCSADDEIPENRRLSLERSSLGFVHELSDGNPERAYASMTSEVKQAIPQDKFVEIYRQTIQSMRPFEKARVSKLQSVRLFSWGEPRLVFCTLRGDSVLVAAKPLATQAHVILEGETGINGWAFSLWLIREQDWQIQHFHVTWTRAAGRSTQDIWNLARSEERLGHHFNAAVLYGTAGALAARGPNFQTRLQKDIATEMGKVPLPYELQGQTPFSWHLEGADFKILGVRSVGVGDKIYLAIAQEIDPWKEDQEPDRRNRELIPRFIRAFPEYLAAFEGLIVEARERGTGRGYRTIDAPIAATQ
jgi:hypothetical protein